jgi:hypothetical protein
MKSTSPYLLLEENMTPIYNKLMLTLHYTICSCKNRKISARSDYNMITTAYFVYKHFTIKQVCLSRVPHAHLPYYMNYDVLCTQFSIKQVRVSRVSHAHLQIIVHTFQLAKCMFAEFSMFPPHIK